MTDCCDKGQNAAGAAGRCGAKRTPSCSGASAGPSEAETPCAWFGRMIQNCLEYASAQKEAGRPIVGIMCEYTPRELIMAAGGVPICLCGGSPDTIPAAEEHLPTNLCPLIKSTFGYHAQKSNPQCFQRIAHVDPSRCRHKSTATRSDRG